MKNNYLIDGNNIIHKMPKLYKLAKKSEQGTREKLTFLLDRYFYNKNINCTVYFDGFVKEAIKTNKIKIQYSNNKTADDLIRNDIEGAKNPRQFTIVSSDLGITDLARVCSCKIIKSEDFGKLLDNENENSGFCENKENEIIKSLNNENWTDLFLKGKK
ncbi:MAG: NYN domain-containing protein [bacterium]